MSESYIFTYYCEKKILDYEFWKGLIDTLLKHGAYYNYSPDVKFPTLDPAFGYRNYEIEEWIFSVPLDEAIEKTADHKNGAIMLAFNEIDFYISATNMKHLNHVNFIVDRMSQLFNLTKDDVNIFNSMIEGLYFYLKPIYGYPDSTLGVGSPTAEEIIKGDIKCIDEINIFSKMIVEKFGREKLLSINSWKTTEFPDGGMIVYLYDSDTSIFGNFNTLSEIESQLGLEPCYEYRLQEKPKERKGVLQKLRDLRKKFI